VGDFCTVTSADWASLPHLKKLNFKVKVLYSREVNLFLSRTILFYITAVKFFFAYWNNDYILVKYVTTVSCHLVIAVLWSRVWHSVSFVLALDKGFTNIVFFIQHCFICLPSDSAVSEDARIKLYRRICSFIASNLKNLFGNPDWFIQYKVWVRLTDFFKEKSYLSSFVMVQLRYPGNHAGF
jgi:hypothetical protein